MGVKDLWKLLEPAGRPVKLESLEGIVVGVDVSIWLNQAVKGVRDRRGEPVPYAHLIVLFNRICKLLHYHIKPVFVFDGATPQLKQKTLASRSKSRDVASQRSLRAADKRASKLLQAKILAHLTGEKSSVNVAASSSGQSDMFHLPPIPEGALSKDKSPTFEEPLSSVQSANNAYYSDVASMDVHSKEFDSLPPEVQHEILLERQQIEKYSYHDPDTLPQVANDFSNYQLSRLMKRSHIFRKLEGVRKVLKSNDTAVVGLGEESKVHEVETNRIVSSEASHYILVKGMDIESQSSQDEEDDSQSQTSSLDMGIGTDVGSFPDPIPKPEDVDPGIGNGGACLTAAREEIEHEVRKFFKERLVAEDKDKISMSGLATGEKSAAVAGSKECTVMLESESSGEEEVEEAQKEKNRREKPDIEGVMSQLLERGDMTGNHKEQLPSVTGPSSLISKEMVVTGEESSDTAMTTKPNDVLPIQTAVNVTTSTNEEKAVEHSRIVSVGTAIKEKREVSPSVDLSATLIAQEQLKSLATSPSKQTTSENTERDLHPTHSSVADVVALIESHEGDSPSPLSAAVEVKSDEGGSPSPWAAGWSGGEEVEALLTVAPSEAQEQLSAEMEELEKEMTRQSRAAATVSNQMYKEAQELISLFGLPYLMAPTEAEAQCAALNEQELTQGTITDDNDIFLFGGRRVYRHFFSQNREVELYTTSELQQRLGLSRDHLIVLAYLLGSDYSEGLEGIGIVMAMEVLRDFPGTGLEPLIKLRDWYNQVSHKPVIVSKGSALQKKLCQYPLPAGFPNTAVRDSYLHPEIDDSSEQFEWGKPDLDLIRRFTFEKMGWSQEKVDEILLPVLKRMNARESQRQQKITQFLPSLPSSTSPSLASPTKQRRAIKSRRIRNVVARLTAGDEEEQVPKPKSGPAKRTRGTRTTKKRQPAAKRQKKSNADHEESSPSSSEVSQPVLKGPNLSASSSSSSEDEFDSLVKNWNEEILVNAAAVEDAASVRTKGQKRT